MYEVLIDDKRCAEYPHYEQCLAWCYMHGHVLEGFPDFLGDKYSKALANGVEIKESPSVP